MLSMRTAVSRRGFLSSSLAAGGGLFLAGRSPGAEDVAIERRRALAGDKNKALVAITLDLEMSRNFPQWESTQWDYEKGNLNAETKAYAVEACRRVKAAGGVLHTFCVGRVLEQENVDWLKEIAAAGHPVGNHTYDHVHFKAPTLKDLQFRFARSPWLVEGREVADVIAENVRLTNLALKERAGIDVAGFRTPGGFTNGLHDRPDLQQMLLGQGFTWVSSLYPAHPNSEPKRQPSASVYAGIVKAQADAQPFVYPSGLIEVPMSPISDIGAFRGGRWNLEWFLEAIRQGVVWAIEQGAAFDLLAHPSCLYPSDPEFKTIDLVCDLVRRAGAKAAIVDLDTIAERARLQAKKSD